MPADPHVKTEGLSALFYGKPAVRDVTLEFPRLTVSALIGPSGCGKSTFLRCLNRMHEMYAGATTDGTVTISGENVYASDINPVDIRKRVGMVLQKPTPFPTMSIAQNVLAGLKVHRKRHPRDEMEAIVEKSLRGAALWEEVKDRLDSPAIDLSGGQQQRLCIARAIAPQPEILLLDEPTASLDPVSTQAIEDLIQDLKRDYTVIMVTHNMQQAARVSEYTAFLYLGELVEHATTDKIFTNPDSDRTEAYVTGRFG